MNIIITMIKKESLQSILITLYHNFRPPFYDNLFDEFEELDDGEGFMAKNGKIYYYDKFGGWYDDIDNQYYNQDGEKCLPYNDPLLDEYLSEEDFDYEEQRDIEEEA